VRGQRPRALPRRDPSLRTDTTAPMVHGRGDQLSAYRDLGLSAVTGRRPGGDRCRRARKQIDWPERGSAYGESMIEPASRGAHSPRSDVPPGTRLIFAIFGAVLAVATRWNVFSESNDSAGGDCSVHVAGHGLSCTQD